MDYARNYLNTTSLAERIRESATKGETVKAAGGLGGRDELRQARQEMEYDFSQTRARYMNDIQDMFSSISEMSVGPETYTETGGMSEKPADFSLSNYVGEALGDVDLSEYSTDAAERIEGKLIEKGLPEHLAKGFVINFMDESGLNPTINESNPTVPGSRGGFGLYQLTGPRRVAYESYAKERGVNLSDPMEQEDAQLDFMLMELETTENRAWKKIQEAPDAGTAAALIVTHFLRPLEEHRNSRVKKYTGI
jgi:hypothetical protein